jgi:hypothetical protein
VAYLERSGRELELTRHVSLVLLDPLALVSVRETGRCRFALPEAFFDMDHPGHYQRRTRIVRVTIPCVTGPYTSINGTLTLRSSRVRIDAEAQEFANDRHFSTRYVPVRSSIALSTAQSDSGMFEVNLGDERYLPFEGAGVISEWDLEIPKECNAFDYDTISDVVLHLSYTARDGGPALREAALAASVLPAPAAQPQAQENGALPDQPNLLRLFRVRHEFASEWHRFLHPAAADGKHSLDLPFTPERFPFRLRGRTLTLGRVELFLHIREGKVGDKSYVELFGEAENPLEVVLTPPGSAAATSSTQGENEGIQRDPDILGGLPRAKIDAAGTIGGATRLKVEIPTAAIEGLNAALVDTVEEEGTTYRYLKPELVEDLFLLCHYSAST